MARTTPTLAAIADFDMSQHGPASIVKAVYEAYVRKDRTAIEALIAPDFHFTSPLDNRLDRQTYLERCWPNSANIAEFKFIHVIANNDLVVVTYEGSTHSGRRFRNTELLTVRGAQVTNVEVYFGWSIPHKAAVGSFVDAP
jgi:ketosteroid isomerase-like protein